MNVTVTPHVLMQAAWREYVRSLPGNRAERARLALERWNEFVATIVEVGGPPDGAAPDFDRFPDSYWCAFPGGLLVLVHFPTPRRVGIFRRIVEALAVEMNFSPGLLG
jgi:hypothetical protein